MPAFYPIVKTMIDKEATIKSLS